MKNLIVADVMRILRKPTYRVIMGLSLFAALAVAVYTRMHTWSGFAFATDQYAVASATELLFGIMIYLTVYADEFSANSMQALIGHGLSRFKLLLAKCIDGGIITVISFGVYTVWVLALGRVLGAPMNEAEIAFLCGELLVDGVKSFGFAALAMIVLYGTKNVSLATTVDVVLIVASSLFLAIFQNIPKIKFMHLEQTVFSGAVDCAGIDWQLVGGAALGSLFWELFKVIVISLLLSYLLFRKKELDF